MPAPSPTHTRRPASQATLPYPAALPCSGCASPSDQQYEALQHLHLFQERLVRSSSVIIAEGCICGFPPRAAASCDSWMLAQVLRRRGRARVCSRAELATQQSPSWPGLADMGMHDVRAPGGVRARFSDPSFRCAAPGRRPRPRPTPGGRGAAATQPSSGRRGSARLQALALCLCDRRRAPARTERGAGERRLERRRGGNEGLRRDPPRRRAT